MNKEVFCSRWVDGGITVAVVDWRFGERKIVLQVMLTLNPGWIVGRR